MMFVMHESLMLALIALVGGVALMVWGLRHDGTGTAIATFFGVIIVAFVIINIICIGHTGFNYWREGYFTTPGIISTDNLNNVIPEESNTMINNDTTNTTAGTTPEKPS